MSLNTYAQVGTGITGSGLSLSQFVAQNVTGGTLTITVNQNSSQDQLLMLVRQIVNTSGLDSGTGTPAGQYQATPGNTANAITTTAGAGNLTPTGEPGLISGFCYTDGGVSLTAGTSPNSFTSGINQAAPGVGFSGRISSESFLYSALTAIAATWTTSSATVFALSGAALFVQSGGTIAVYQEAVTALTGAAKSCSLTMTVLGGVSLHVFVLANSGNTPWSVQDSLAQVVVQSAPFGPGISPDYRTMFSRRVLSTYVPPPVLTQITGFASAQAQGLALGAVFLQLTGWANAEAQGAGGPLQASGTLTGLANATARGFGTVTGAAALSGGFAHAGGFAYATISEAGAGSMTGLGVGMAHAWSGILTGTGVLTGETFAAATSGPASLLGAGALSGWSVATFASRGPLGGSIALTGVAGAAGFSYGSPSAFASMVGRALAQAAAAQAPMTGAGRLTGTAAALAHTRGLLLYVGAGELTGVARAGSFGYGPVITSLARFGWAQVTVTGSAVTGQQISVALGGPYPTDED